LSEAKLHEHKNISSVLIFPVENGDFEIYSITGSLVEKGRCETSGEIAGGLIGGLYILKFISDSGQTASEKFMVSR